MNIYIKDDKKSAQTTNISQIPSTTTITTTNNQKNNITTNIRCACVL